MHIAVVAPSGVPFAFGGAERTWLALVEHLNADTPHVAELLKLPSRERSVAELVASYRTFAELDLGHFDLVITSKYPAWMVEHPRHVLYLFHPLRGLYDTYPAGLPPALDPVPASARRLISLLRSPSTDVRAILDAAELLVGALDPGDPILAFPGPLARELVRRLDAIALGPDRTVRHLAISRTVASRAGYFPPGITAEVVVPPSGLTGGPSRPAEHVLSAGRIDGPKRVGLLVEAYADVPGDLPLLVAGTGPELARLERLAAQDPRVHLLGHVPDQQLADLYAACAVVPFLPLDEDLGLVTFEAFSYGKPVITLTDSGGPTEFVRDGWSGWVVEPTRGALARALTEALADPEEAKARGERGRAIERAIDWAPVLEAITEPPRRSPEHRPARPHRGGHARPRVLALSTYPIDRPQGGGQLRMGHLLSALVPRNEVVVCAVTPTTSEVVTSEPSPGIVQVLVPAETSIHQEDARWSSALGVPAGDLAVAIGGPEAPGLLSIVADLARQVDLVVLEQPYLAPVASLVADNRPWLYDAHNAEHHMKAAIYGSTETGTHAVRLVADAEATAVRRSQVITYCSPMDREALSAAGPTLADWHLVVNGVDVAAAPVVPPEIAAPRRAAWLGRFAATTGRAELRNVALFVGSDHPPNHDAARLLLRQAPSTPHILYVLVGSHTRVLADVPVPDNVLVIGRVDTAQLDRFYALADVALNPMLDGGGTNLKLVEAFARRVPVITTAVGARGLLADPASVAAVCEPDVFCSTVAAALTDPRGLEARVGVARRVAEDFYDWHRVGPRFAQAVAAAFG